MIYYRPTDGDPRTGPIEWRPRTCFLMTQLGGQPHDDLVAMRDRLIVSADAHDFAVVDADTVVTGRDFLLKIWNLAVATPVGVALVHESMSKKTLANVFYEIGLMQAYGRETLVIKSEGAEIPSDFIRTEYVKFDGDADRRLDAFFAELEKRARYYVVMAEQLERNPLLAIDYLRRAYLLCEDDALREAAESHLEGAGVEGRARNSVERLAVRF